MLEHWAWLLIASTLPLAVYVHQDRIWDCADGQRYTSRAPQPYPFHRRFHYWPKRLLQVTTFLSFTGLGVLMGTPGKAILLLTLPGVWFVTTHPTCTDAPCLLLATLSSMLLPTNMPLAIFCSCLAGVFHERAPVFAALYAWSPWPLIGLIGVQWWVKAGKPDGDGLVGRGLLYSIKAHRPYQDLLDGRAAWTGLRALLPAAFYLGVSPRVWATFAVAMGTRIVGSDTSRFLMWAAPPMVLGLPELPPWYIALHVITMKRAI